MRARPRSGRGPGGRRGDALRLSALAAEVPHAAAGPGDPDVTSITHDSRAAKPGSLFAAYPGLRSDGRRFVADAVAR
ncbi:MAG TPA: Mur ligase domain-containing protein, partial [Thermoanaerobaculia bacterium]|nr:Mur ligase domain-containing protein [Thermoanaerobaculia bacterium]